MSPAPAAAWPSPPRAGSDVTHRLLVLLDPAAPPPGPATTPGPAARLDPVTAAWVARLLPNPALVGVVVRWVDPDGGEAAAPVEVAASALEVDAMGWVRLAANAAELAERLVRAAAAKWRTAHGSTPPGRAVWDDTQPMSPTMLPLADLLAAAGAAGRAVANRGGALPVLAGVRALQLA